MTNAASPTVRLLHGADMPRLGLGTFPLDDRESERVVAEAIGVGYRLIDTAERYGNEVGVSRGLKASGVAREELRAGFVYLPESCRRLAPANVSIVDLSGTAALPSRLPTLTGIRFIAAAMVFLFHANLQGLFASPEAGGAFNSIASQGGWAGVGFFFILSGFVLTWAARPGDSTPGFWRRRFFKIYPKHLVTLIAAVLLITLVARESIELWRAIPNVLLVQAWFPDLNTSLTLNTVSWSLSVEVLFYLSFPLLLRFISRIRPAWLWFWAGGVVAVILVIPVIAGALPPSEPWMPWANAEPNQFWFVYISPPVRMLEFVFGIVLARVVLTGRKVPLGLGGAMALSVLAYFLAPIFPGTYPIAAVMVLPLGLLIAAVAVAVLALLYCWRGRRSHWSRSRSCAASSARGAGHALRRPPWSGPWAYRRSGCLPPLSRRRRTLSASAWLGEPWGTCSDLA